MLATNTSSLSVEQLAQATRHPPRIAGLHFFNPVHRMELVEIVRTDETSNDVIETLVRFVRQLGKTPIVVKDSPGFLVNRILFPYLAEAARMVSEGYGVTVIDGEMRGFGMPMGPLELLDQVGIDVAWHVANAMSPVLCDAEPTAKLLAEMVDRGWLGKKTGRGFYHYQKAQRGKPAIGKVNVNVANSSNAPAFSYLQQRLVYPLINESARCLGEEIVEEAWMVDLAMVLGTGFAPFRGGPLRLTDELGIERVVADLRRLQDAEGDRFAPSATLHRMDQLDQRFYPLDHRHQTTRPARLQHERRSK